MSLMLTAMRKNKDGLHQCRGCDQVEDLIGFNIDQQRDSDTRRSRATLHNTFGELDKCAIKCQTCRVFRQSLLLEEVTFKRMQRIHETRGKVVVQWQEPASAASKSGAFLKVAVDGAPRRAGVVNLAKRNEVSHLTLHPNALDVSVVDQARQWLKHCVEGHIGDCDNLSYSTQKPRFLIEILSSENIQLREGRNIRPYPAKRVDYVALSYCWGTLLGAELEVVEQAKTFKTNWEDRLQPFSTRSLPATVRDSIRFIQAMGIRYAWVDALCRRQDTDEDLATMHHVYSNALFTLCACATDKATMPLLEQRDAWSLGTEPCRLGGQYLTTSDMSLNELRLRSPLADRAWTLQEERLSPRILYLSSSRVYWSCAKDSSMELRSVHEFKSYERRRPIYSTSGQEAVMPLPQDFLVACFDRKLPLYPFWAEIVQSFASRSMSTPKDRLTALSGLAAKYLSANTSDRYLAGLWANNFADGLAWKLDKAVSGRRLEDDDRAPKLPTWSWAALPLETIINTSVESAPSAHFKLIPDAQHEPMLQRDPVEIAIENGNRTSGICVSGRMRNLWGSSSRYTEWLKISHNSGEIERFTFSINPQQDMHSVDLAKGRVLVYEHRKKEIVGQIDFHDDVMRLLSDDMGLAALEIAETIALLLERKEDGTHRRVGVAWNVRQDFFVLSGEPKVVVLV